ncbi:hypothetical protein WJR50_31055 [Catalinimonas sp. 4WD22]|uniref:hypothetical protein n=1 Tax=Catalinimonas locisalis TaxID=3133978 RepID=UPI003100F473
MIENLKVGATLTFTVDITPVVPALPAGHGPENRSDHQGTLYITPPQRETETSTLINRNRPSMLMPRFKENLIPYHMSYIPFAGANICYCQFNQMVVSNGFQGCLMAIYMYFGNRRVAHVFSSSVPAQDTKTAFKNLMNQAGYQFIKYFRPFSGNNDEDFHVNVVTRGMATHPPLIAAPNKVETLGIVTSSNECYSVDVRKIGNDNRTFDVLRVRRKMPVRHLGFI